MNGHAVITASSPSRATLASRPAPSICRYYVGEGSQASELVGRGMTLMYAHVDVVDRFQRLHRADAVHMTADGRIRALAYEYESGDPEVESPAVRAGLKFVGREDSLGGDDHQLRVHLYQPDKGTPLGQAIAQQIRAIWPFNLSSWLLRELGLPTSNARRDPLAPVSCAGTRKGRLLVSIAVDPAQKPFTPAPWLREIPHKTFTTYTEE